MTIFRGELGGWFLVMFISLLVGKVWGWIGEGRVEYLEQQPPANPRLFHTRLAVSLVLSVLFNAFMLRYCVNTVIRQPRPDMMVMFGFEFAILTLLSASTTARYGIALAEIYVTRQQLKAKMDERRAEIREARLEAIREHARAGESSPPTDLPSENDINELEFDVPGWEGKAQWVFYLDLLTDLLKLIVYLVFFAILLTFYGLPIHILRDVVVTIRSFVRRITDFLRYRNATRDMNERYPDATAEEVAREEVCIICREEMVSIQPAAGAPEEGAPQPAAGTQRVPERLRPKKLPCGHILHFSCLMSWLARQQNCPTCRRPVILTAAARAREAAAANANNAGNGAGGLNMFANGHPGRPAGNQAPGQPGAQGDGLPRARVFQFGPFRFGFGAARGGDLFNNLHQQIHQGNAPLQPAANVNPQGARQIGFGFGFGRRPVVTPQGLPQQGHPQQGQPQFVNPSLDDTEAQLQQIEQQITEQIRSVRRNAERLRLVRSVQRDLQQTLQELSGLHPGMPSLATQAPGTLPQAGALGSNLRQFVAGPESSTLTSGDSRLPEGLTLPPGWTLVPLEPAEQAGQHTPQGANPTPTVDPTNVHSSQASQPPVTSATPTRNTNDNAGPRENTISLPDSGPSGAETQSASSPLPNWDASTGSSSVTQRADSPSQEWTDIRSEQVPNTSQPVIPSWGSSHTYTNEASHEDSTYSDSSSKGKGRAATVEETDETTN